MADNTKTSVQIGPGFLGILTLIFITLKLTGFIAWSWLWVLAPLWIPFVIVLGIFLAAGLIYLVFLGVSAIQEANNERKFRKARRRK